MEAEAALVIAVVARGVPVFGFGFGHPGLKKKKEKAAGV